MLLTVLMIHYSIGNIAIGQRAQQDANDICCSHLVKYQE